MELIPNLCNNSAHDQIEVRHAALQTLGMICEELLPEDLNDQLKSLIVQALTRNICLDPGLEVTTELAVSAFSHALPYAS